MQPLQPFRVADVGFAPGHVLGVARVNHHHLETPLLEDLEDRDPVNPGRFHDHGFHSTTSEPVRQAMKIIGKSPERLDGLLVTVRADGRDMHGGTNINRRRGGVNPRQFP
jgi:hypothetical protein